MFRTVFEPLFVEHGLSLSFIDAKEARGFECEARVKAQGLLILIRSGTASYGASRFLDVRLKLKKGESMRAYSEDLWTVATEDPIELREFQRYLSVPFWRLWPVRFSNSGRNENLEKMAAYRDRLAKHLVDPMNGNLTPLFELQTKRILVPVYGRIKQRAEQWAAKNVVRTNEIRRYVDGRVDIPDSRRTRICTEPAILSSAQDPLRACRSCSDS